MLVNVFFKISNFFNTRFAILFAFLILNFFFSGALKAQLFDKTKDILIAQFDNVPDADDIQSQAALACILAHPDGSGVNYYAVTGAYGEQSKVKYIDSRTLFAMCFGTENVNWTDAHLNWTASVTRIKDKVKPILLAGGTAWVQEAGQSNITADWIAAILADGVPAATVKNKVKVVQHSSWNEGQTAATDLTYVQTNATYIPIDDGNTDWGTGTDRGPNTPNFKSGTTTTDKQYLLDAKATTNPNTTARNYWTEADRIIDASGFSETYSPIDEGGLDYSDAVEVWYILDLGDNANTIRKFWDRYVVNNPTSTVPVAGVTLSGCPASSLIIGNTVQLTATVQPTTATNRNLSWTTTNNAVAIVSGTGLVTAVGVGSTTITVTTQDQSLTATCDITVVSVGNEQITIAISTPGTSTWTCPANVQSVTVECWGGGGAGGSAFSKSNYRSRAHGGAGGNYTKVTKTSPVAMNYTVTVGAGGTAFTLTGTEITNGTYTSQATQSGGNTLFKPEGGANWVLANGGNGGPNSVANTGAVNVSPTNNVNATGSTGDTFYSGGRGAGVVAGGATGTGGGGGGAGSSGNGGAAGDAAFQGSTFGLGGSPDGGNGAAGRAQTSNGNGNNGNAPGGGGSGANNQISDVNGGLTLGGAGAPGKIIITLTGSSITVNSGQTLTIASGETLTVKSGSTLTVNTNALLTVASGGILLVQTGGILNVAAGGKITNEGSITNNGTINFLSDATNGTATYIGGAIGGTVKVNQSLQHSGAKRTWYVSSPVLETVAPTPALTTIKTFNEAANTWSASLTQMEAKKGYLVVPTAAANDLLFTGTLNTGNQDITLTGRSGGGDYQGFNLVGNPYPSYLDWSEVTPSNGSTILRSSTMWYRTKNASLYSFWTVSGDGTVSPATASKFIPPMQAFWVRSVVGGSTLVLRDSMRAHAPANNKLLKVSALNERTLVRFEVSNGENTDEAVIYFTENAQNGLDMLDAPKMNNDNLEIPEIHTSLGNEKIVINAMNSIPMDTPIGIGFKAGNATSFSLKANEVTNLPEGVKLILRDNVTFTETDLTDGVSSYTFSPEVTSNDRFSVIFRSPGTITDISSSVKQQMQVYVNGANRIVIVASGRATYSIYNALGMQLETGVMNSKLETHNANFISGVYIVKVNNQSTRVIIK